MNSIQIHSERTALWFTFKVYSPNASVETNFGDLLIPRWSRLEIPWNLKVFQSWCLLHPFLILSHVSRKEFGKWPDTLPQLASRLMRKTWWVGILESKCERNRGFAWSLLIPFARPRLVSLKRFSKVRCPAEHACHLLRERVAKLADLSVYPIRNFFTTHIRRVPLQAETSHQHQKELKFAWERCKLPSTSYLDLFVHVWF